MPKKINKKYQNGPVQNEHTDDVLVLDIELHRFYKVPNCMLKELTLRV